MRYVEVQAPVVLVDKNGKPITEPDPEDEKKQIEKKPITHHAFLMTYVVNDAKLVEEKAGIRQVAKIGVGYEGFKRTGKLDRGFKDKEPGTFVAVEDEDWKVVKTILEEKEGLAPTIGVQLLPFFSSWVEAKEAKPETKPELPA